MSKVIIAFTGLRNAGKSEIAKFVGQTLCRNFNMSVATVNFSDPIYDIMVALGFTREQIADKAYREKPQASFGGKSLIDLMVSVGTDWGRDTISNNIWIDIATKRMYDVDTEIVICEAARFHNEIIALRKEFGNHLIHVAVDTHLEMVDSNAEREICELMKSADVKIDNSNHPDIDSNPEVWRTIHHAINLIPRPRY